jgi:hypothetical protein
MLAIFCHVRLAPLIYSTSRFWRPHCNKYWPVHVWAFSSVEVSRRGLCIPLCFLRAACPDHVILLGLIKASKCRQIRFIKHLLILSRLYILFSTWDLRTFGICLRFTVWLVPDVSRLLSGVIFKGRVSDNGRPWQMRPPRCLETSGASYPVTRRHIPEE